MSSPIVIIGAGPAGSVASAQLARAGLPVCLIEQHTFPRDKVCGECLSPLGLDVLDRLGLIDAVQAAGCVHLHYAGVHAPDGRCVILPLPRPCIGLSRSALDAILLEHAIRSGVHVHQPARCEGVTVMNQANQGAPASPGHAAPAGLQPNVSVLVRDLAHNRLLRLEADYVLWADGKSAFSGVRPPLTGDLGIKAHFEKVAGPRNRVELFGVRGHYVGLNPIEAGRWNLALSIPAVRVRAANGDLDGALALMMKQNPGLKSRLKDASRCSPWQTCPLPRFAVDPQRWPRGVLPIGNAAAAIEPIGGEGMGLAMRSAELTATALVQHIRGGCGACSNPAGPGATTRLSVQELAPVFQRLWRTRLITARAAAQILSHPILSIASLDLLSHSEGLQRALLALLGKTITR